MKHRFFYFRQWIKFKRLIKSFKVLVLNLIYLSIYLVLFPVVILTNHRQLKLLIKSLFFWVSWLPHKHIKRNLSKAFPAKPKEEIAPLVKKAALFPIYEFGHIMRCSLDPVNLTNSHLQGLEEVVQSYQSGKIVFILSGHFRYVYDLYFFLEKLFQDLLGTGIGVSVKIFPGNKVGVFDRHFFQDFVFYNKPVYSLPYRHQGINIKKLLKKQHIQVWLADGQPGGENQAIASPFFGLSVPTYSLPFKLHGQGKSRFVFS